MMSSGERVWARAEPGLGEEARRAAGGAAATDVAAGEHEVGLGTRGGDIEQPPFLLEVLGGDALQRAPRGQELLLAAEQQDQLGLAALGAMDRTDGDAAVLARLDLLGVQAGGVLEEAAQRGARADVFGEGLGGAAERTQVLEGALGVAALVGP